MKYLAIVGVVITAFIAVTVAPATNDITICHVAGLASDPANYITLELPEQAVYGEAGHFNEDGTPQAGHEQDSFGECDPPPPPVDYCDTLEGVQAEDEDCPPPTEECPPGTVENEEGGCDPVVVDPRCTVNCDSPPPPPNCVPTGAGQDGNIPPGGNTNDNCLPVTTTTTTSSGPPICVPTTVEVVRTVTVTGPTKTVTKVKNVTKWKTRVIYKTRTITKTKIVYVKPKGVHKNGVEANG